MWNNTNTGEKLTDEAFKAILAEETRYLDETDPKGVVDPYDAFNGYFKNLKTYAEGKQIPLSPKTNLDLARTVDWLEGELNANAIPYVTNYMEINSSQVFTNDRLVKIWMKSTGMKRNRNKPLLAAFEAVGFAEDFTERFKKAHQLEATRWEQLRVLAKNKLEKEGWVQKQLEAPDEPATSARVSRAAPLLVKLSKGITAADAETALAYELTHGSHMPVDDKLKAEVFEVLNLLDSPENTKVWNAAVKAEGHNSAYNVFYEFKDLLKANAKLNASRDDGDEMLGKMASKLEKLADQLVKPLPKTMNKELEGFGGESDRGASVSRKASNGITVPEVDDALKLEGFYVIMTDKHGRGQYANPDVTKQYPEAQSLFDGFNDVPTPKEGKDRYLGEDAGNYTEPSEPYEVHDENGNPVMMDPWDPWEMLDVSDSLVIAKSKEFAEKLSDKGTVGDVLLSQQVDMVRVYGEAYPVFGVRIKW